jgi:hypothetical protein
MYFTCPNEEKNEKIFFSSHKLPKQQSTNFWSQGILGVKRLHYTLPTDILN